MFEYFKDFETNFAKLQFGGKKRNRFYKKMVKYIGNGVPMPRALDILWNFSSDEGRKPKESQAIVLDLIRRQVAEGRKFGQAIKGIVPESDRLVIEGGETAGNLTVAIEKAMAINASSGKIKRTVIQGATYPVMLIFAAMALLVLIVRQVVPAFDAVLPRDQWQGLGAQMAFVASLVDNYLYYGIGVAAALVILIGATMTRWTGGLRLWADRIPPWSIYRLVMGSGFMLTVAGMIKAGIPLPTVLAMLGRDASPWYKARIDTTLKWVDEGLNLGEALHKTGYNFPDRESVQDLRAYAALNKFDEALESMGNDWLTESVEKIELQTAVLKNIGFLVLGLTFMWIYGGIFSLQQQITQSLG